MVCEYCNTVLLNFHVDPLMSTVSNICIYHRAPAVSSRCFLPNRVILQAKVVYHAKLVLTDLLWKVQKLGDSEQ